MTLENININTDDLLIFRINSESNIQINTENQEGVNVGIGHDIQDNLEESKIKITLTIRIENPENNFAEFEISSFFEIANKESYLIEFEKKIVFHPQLIATLLSVSYSTSRGMIFEKLKNTYWKDLILPIVSPTKLLHQQ